MKYCKECGAKLNETSKFCLECGASVHTETTSPIQDLPVEDVNYSTNIYETKEEKKKDTHINKTAVIITIIMAISLIIVTVLFITFGNKSKSINDAGQTSAASKETTPQSSNSSIDPASAEDYIGITLNEVWEMYGEDYSEFNYNGGKFITYDGTVYSFGAFDASGNTEFTGDEVLDCIVIDKSGYVTNEIYVGMNFDEIQKAYGSSLEEFISTDDVDGGLYLNFPYKKDYEIAFSWSGDDRTKPSDLGMIKITNNTANDIDDITADENALQDLSLGTIIYNSNEPKQLKQMEFFFLPTFEYTDLDYINDNAFDLVNQEVAFGAALENVESEDAVNRTYSGIVRYINTRAFVQCKINDGQLRADSGRDYFYHGVVTGNMITLNDGTIIPEIACVQSVVTDYVWGLDKLVYGKDFETYIPNVYYDLNYSRCYSLENEKVICRDYTNPLTVLWQIDDPNISSISAESGGVLIALNLQGDTIYRIAPDGSTY